MDRRSSMALSSTGGYYGFSEECMRITHSFLKSGWDITIRVADRTPWVEPKSEPKPAALFRVK